MRLSTDLCVHVYLQTLAWPRTVRSVVHRVHQLGLPEYGVPILTGLGDGLVTRERRGPRFSEPRRRGRLPG